MDAVGVNHVRGFEISANINERGGGMNTVTVYRYQNYGGSEFDNDFYHDISLASFRRVMRCIMYLVENRPDWRMKVSK